MEKSGRTSAKMVFLGFVVGVAMPLNAGCPALQALGGLLGLPGSTSSMASAGTAGTGSFGSTARPSTATSRPSSPGVATAPGRTDTLPKTDSSSPIVSNVPGITVDNSSPPGPGFTPGPGGFAPPVASNPGPTLGGGAPGALSPEAGPGTGG